MTPAEVAALVRVYTQTNSTTFSDANMLVLFTPAQQEIAEEICLELQDENYFKIKHTASLVGDDRFYSLPEDFLARISKVEAKLDQTNWIVLKELKHHQHDKPSDETNITYNFSNLEGEAYYEIRHEGIFIWSGTVAAVTNGLVIYLDTYPNEITDLTSATDMGDVIDDTHHGLPTPVHELLARKISMIWKQTREKPLPLNERELKYDFDLRRKLSVLRFPSKDSEIIGKLPDPQYRGNDGKNY